MKLLTIEAVVTTEDTLTIDGKRYHVTGVGVRVPKDSKGQYVELHANSPIEYFVMSGDNELFSMPKQRGKHLRQV